MLSLILSMVIHLIAAAAQPASDARWVRCEVADGSVWANIWETHDGSPSLRTTVRLRDADPRLRFVSADVDGDGRLDVVAFTHSGQELQVWRGTDEGFVRVE